MLDWGRRYLMCPPDHFAVAYEINPWMHREVNADRDRAHEQWQHLADTIRAAGASVETLTPEAHVPDLVFTANAGLVSGNRFIPSQFRHPERRPETPGAERSWYSERLFQPDARFPLTHLLRRFADPAGAFSLQ